MKKIFTLLLATISVGSIAQVKNFEFKAAANSTFINSATKNLNPFAAIPVDPYTGYTSYTSNLGSIKESHKSNVGFDFLSTFQVWEYKNFFLRTGLGIQYLRFQRKTTIENQAQGIVFEPGSNPLFTPRTGYPYGSLFGSFYPRDVDGIIVIDAGGQLFPPQVQLLETNPNLGKTTTLYLQIPVSIGRTFFSEKLMVAANLQTQFLAQGTVVKEEYSYNNGMREYKDKSSDGFKNVLFLVGVESTYKIIKPIAVSIAYNRSLTPIYDEGSQVGGKTFYNNVSVGLNYSLGK